MPKVLIVDDSQMVLSLFKNELQYYKKADVIYAQSYKEAMRMIREHAADIRAAVLDYNLPDAPNGEVIALANSHNIPSVVLTGSLDRRVQDVILKKNVVDFIPKDDPLSILHTIDALNKILKRYETTILIADDSKLSRELIKMSLETVHIKILEAENGKQALEMINDESNDIALLITDYQMPQMDGIELTLALRKKYTKSQLGIIAISASEDEETIYKFLKFGANSFINKPPVPNEVITTVSANLELLYMFEQIKEMANKDFLTGAYNRRYFFEAGNAIFLKAKRKEQPLAVIMLDIDNFKNINDTYGHDTGDIAIKEIKRLLDENLRRSDLFARFGGEEFCILLEEITRADTEMLFEKIRKTFEENTIDVNGKKLSYTVSFGGAYGMASSLEAMVGLADKALYYSKENGRNRVTIHAHES